MEHRDLASQYWDTETQEMHWRGPYNMNEARTPERFLLVEVDLSDSIPTRRRTTALARPTQRATCEPDGSSLGAR
jgi:hypothetical protein